MNRLIVKISETDGTNCHELTEGRMFPKAATDIMALMFSRMANYNTVAGPL